LISNISGKAECVSHVDFSANTVIDYNNKIEFEIQTEESLDSVNWDFGDGNNSTKFEPNHTYLEAGLYNVILHYYYSDGCDSILYKEVIIEASEESDCAVHFNYLVDSIDSNKIVFTGSPIEGSVYSSTWDFDDGTYGNENPVTKIYDSSGDYNVCLTASTDFECSNTFCQIVQINGVEENECADFNSSLKDSENVTCFGGSNGSAIINTTGGTTPYTYDWHDGTGQSLDSTSNDLFHGTYNVTVSDINGCLDSVIFSITSPDESNLSNRLGNDTNLCGGESLLLNVGTNWETVSWSTGATTNTNNVNESGTYTATVTDLNGCETIDSITVSFHALPNINLGSDTTICFGDTALLKAGEEWASYSWSTGAVTNTINVSESGTYTLIVTDYVGCQVSENVNIAVSVPDFDLGNDTTVFTLDSFSLDAGEGWMSYAWANEEITQAITVESGGVYYVTVTNSLGCEVSDSLTVTLSSEGNCFAAFGYEADSTYVTFTNQSQGTYTDVHYDFGDGTSSNLPSPVKSYNQSGTYSVCINVFHSLTGCVSDSCYSITVLKDTSEVFCQADFEFTSIGAKKFAFYNTSAGNFTDVKWEFHGGENIVRSDSAEFEFPNSGYFEVCLSVFDSSSNCFNSICKTVEVIDTNSVNCRSDFDFFIQNTGEVFFNSKASGSYSAVYFSLGDGMSKDTSTFSYRYQNSGHYDVCLSVYDALSGCQDQYCELVVVNLGTSSVFCEAKMDGFVDSENIAHAINQSIGDYTHAHWGFGDGSQSFENSPTHEFLASGYYNICLNIHDSVSGCQSSICEEVNIELDSLAVNCLADFEFIVIDEEVTFKNISLGGNSHMHWSFGDGSYDDGSPVSYNYRETGVYEVCLSTWDSISGCQATVCKQVSIVKDTNTVFCSASFDYIPLSNGEIQFKDASIGNYTNVHWDLGNGIFSDSTSPKGIYPNNGVYPVTVMIWDSISNCQSSYKKEIAIAIHEDLVECHAKFEFFPINDSLVKFKSVSQGAHTNINWDFGDGTFSEGQSEVEHIFPHGGFFTVCVGIYDNQTGCHDLVCDNVVLLKDTAVVDCHANFEFFPTNGSEVVFNNVSEGTFTKSFWKFSTGVSSYDEHPTVNFKAGGLYGACLTVFDSVLGCQDKYCAEVPIIDDTTSYCDAHYEYYMDSRTVNFYPEIKGDITGWIWDYDDGFNSNDSFPSHTYEEDGVYQVCLTVYDSLTGCFNTYCDAISVLGDVTQLDDYVNADFTYFLDPIDGKVYFKDESVGNPSSWYWDFGDGDSAGVYQNPSYEYTEDGFYEVCLTVKNSNNGQESKCEVISVGDVSDACYAKFDFYANAVTATAHFDNNTLGRITGYDWDFGDSITSFQYQPVHSYADTGFYPVCLTVRNDSGCIRTFCNEIRVGNALENKCLIGCVWPGDANLDLESNHYDILPMGLHYGETGPNREESSNDWRGHESQDWSSNLWGDVNNKHGDANGDGIINFSDIEIIETNFAYSHPWQPRAQAANQLSIDWDVDDIDVGETAVLTVSVPDSINVTMYGLGFEIDLDPAVFDYGTIRYDFEGSWLGTEGDDLITFGLENEDLGQIYIAESRNDHNELNGNGELVKIYVTAKANSSNTGAILTTEGGITAEGDTVSFAGEVEEASVNSIEERGDYLVKDLKVFPNPTTNQILFNLPIGTTTEYIIELYDNVGALVYSTSQMNGGLVTQNLKDYHSGVYTIQVSSDKVKYMQKVIVTK
jgi:PKD repeat protein